MQLLEQMSNGDIVLQEGLFKSSASDADYNELLKVAQSICAKIKLPTDSKEYEKNKKALERAKNKHPSSIVLYSIKGKRTKLISFNDKNVRSMSPVYVNDIISLVKSQYKLKDDKYWVVTTDHGVEINRSINAWGPLGNDSWVNIRFAVSQYKSKIENIMMILSISKSNDKRIKKYNKA